MMSSLLQDLRYSLRQLWKSPGFTTVAVLTLALGIGANTAIFSVVYGVLLRPLPFAEPDRLVMLWERWDRPGQEKTIVSSGNFFDWKQLNQSFEQMAAMGGGTPDLALRAGDEDPLKARSTSVSDGFFTTLGARPALGRTFLPDEVAQSGHRVVVIGHGLWQRFGGSPRVIGEQLTIGRQTYTVVGVMPRGFAFPDECQLWFPLPRDAMGWDRNNHNWRVIGRLKPGHDITQAQSEMNSISARLRGAYPENEVVAGVTLVPLREQILGPARRALLVLLGAVSCVLLIACVNAANLMLARATMRRREIALRLALGASRWRVIQHLLAESLLLAILGGALGLAGAYLCVQAFVVLDPLELPRIQEVAVDVDVLGFTLLVSICSSVFVGMLPAWRTSRPDLTSDLKESAGFGMTGGPRNSFCRDSLVTAEVALAIVVLASAGLLLRSFVARVSVPIGFQSDRLLAIELPFWTRQSVDDLLIRLRALPGVEAVSAGTALPHEPAGTSGGFRIEGIASVLGKERRAGKIEVAPGYFRAAGIPLRAGRLLNAADSAKAPQVAVINDALARRFFAGSDPIGKRLHWSGEWWQIVGVVGSVKGFGVDGDPMPVIYRPVAQEGWSNGVYVVVRTALPPASLVGDVRKQLHAWNQRALIDRLTPIEALLSDSVAIPRFYMLLVGAFAALALVLTAVGVFGVVSCSVSQRTHEIGVRMALGADPGDVRSLVVGQGLRPILAGVVIGLLCAFPSMRVLESLLFGVPPNDAITFTAVAALLTGVGMFASYLPARRASKVDPVVALRCE